MQNTIFIWLGAGRSRRHPVGNKGRYLDLAARAGLPVPDGALLLDDFYHVLLDSGVARLAEDGVFIDDPRALDQLLFGTFRFPRLTGIIAVRSAFAAEDQPDIALAGFFTSRLDVNAADPAQLATALADVYTSALKHEGPFRRDILLMHQVAARHAGVAFSESAYLDDLVNYTEGTAERLVGGEEAGVALHLPRLRPGERPTAYYLADAPADPLPSDGSLAFPGRLQQLLRGVRRTCGEGDWDVEWADDGAICWLVQLRPITRPTRRNEAFTAANLNEILPEIPSPFMSSLIDAGRDRYYDYYRSVDATLPAGRPLIELFLGRPLFNISLLTETMRHWGLPTRLVTNSLGGRADIEMPFKLRRFMRKMRPLLRLGLRQARAASHSRRAAPALVARSRAGPDTLEALLPLFVDIFVEFVTMMLDLTAAMSAPLLWLRRAGTLAEHSARHRSRATQLFDALRPLQQLVAGQPAFAATLEDGRLPDDPQFQTAWHAFLHEYGHRGIYETDIAQPRYQEEPSPLIAALLRPPSPLPEPPPRTWRGRLTLPVWQRLRGVLDARETWRHEAMRGFAILRRRLLARAAAAADAGQLPQPEDFWLLTVDEAMALATGITYDAGFFATRRARLTAYARYAFPDLVHRFDDFEAYRTERCAGDAGDGPDHFHGLGLTTGTARGRAWVLRAPSTSLPDGYVDHETILVARAVDAGWIPTFTQVAGVVVETGGDLSHGSIILRELGLPAITNVTAITRHIATGDAVYIDAARGLIRKL